MSKDPGAGSYQAEGQDDLTMVLLPPVLQSMSPMVDSTGNGLDAYLISVIGCGPSQWSNSRTTRSHADPDRADPQHRCQSFGRSPAREVLKSRRATRRDAGVVEKPCRLSHISGCVVG